MSVAAWILIALALAGWIAAYEFNRDRKWWKHYAETLLDTGLPPRDAKGRFVGRAR